MRIVDATPSGFADFLRGGREKQGEDLVSGLLARALGDTHTLLRHLTLTDSNDKLGFVLVGPDGIWHLELLHLASLVNNGGIWMHWDYDKQSVQPVPFTLLTDRARARLAELQAHLAMDGYGARQAMIVTTPGAPHDFSVPGVELVLHANEIGDFVRDVMPQYAPESPIDVDAAVRLLTGKRTAAGPPAQAKGEPSALTTALNRRHRQLGSLTGFQILVLGLLALANCCVLAVVVSLLLSG